MATDLKTMMNRLPADRRKKVDARAAELIAEEMTLRDLRKAHALTQEHMAEVLKIGQDSVSRLEKRSDLMLSTLRGYIAAMGGTMEIVARFPDRPDVTVTGLSELADEKPSPTKKVTRRVSRRPELPAE